MTRRIVEARLQPGAACQTQAHGLGEVRKLNRDATKTSDEVLRPVSQFRVDRRVSD